MIILLIRSIRLRAWGSYAVVIRNIMPRYKVTTLKIFYEICSPLLVRKFAGPPRKTWARCTRWTKYPQTRSIRSSRLLCRSVWPWVVLYISLSRERRINCQTFLCVTTSVPLSPDIQSGHSLKTRKSFRWWYLVFFSVHHWHSATDSYSSFEASGQQNLQGSACWSLYGATFFRLVRKTTSWSYEQINASQQYWKYHCSSGAYLQCHYISCFKPIFTESLIGQL